MDKSFFHCKEAMLLTEGDDCSIYQFRNETGEGMVTVYEVFPGVTLSYNDFHMQYYNSAYQPQGNIFCIDHCREGRLEYPAKEDAYAYVGAGDLKMDRRIAHTGRFVMPLAHYHGIMVAFDMELACISLKEEIKDFPVDIKKLQKKFCPDVYPVVIHEPQSIEHIFGELYMVPQKIRQPYFKLKVYELLLYLEALELPKNSKEHPYYYKTQIEKVRAIEKFLTDHMEQSYTQTELSERFQIPLTTMKQCFKSVYGISIGQWLLQYRMNQAAVMLKNDSTANISEIAGAAGYDSPSKFAAAFKRTMGMSPMEYRNVKR